MNDESHSDKTALADLLESIAPGPDSPHPPLVRKALHLARALQKRASTLQTPQERKQQTELDRMIQNPRDKATITQMTDQAFRSDTAHRASDQLIHILDVQGIPRFFSPIDRTLLKGFQSFGSYLPGVAFPLVKEKMQQETANVILPADEAPLSAHLQARRQAGVRMNVNYLGEALLGEREAAHRLDTYLQALALPALEVLSVKISTVYSQISPLGRTCTIATLCDRMEQLYRAAAKSRFTRADGSQIPKFAYLDMEEYRDKSITAEVFMRTLDRPGLKNVSAGIALQAYLPDSFATQKDINAWARERLSTGGAPVTIRVVKGANMEMERVEASIRGWPQAPFKSKTETDANFKRMLEEGMRGENRAAVRLGVASHNLFDLAYGLVLANEHNAWDAVQFEMLEGMANHQRRALFELTPNLLLYAPACHKSDFIHAIGYLIRRMDENTGPDNFLRHAFKLEVDSPEWRRLEDDFVASFQRIPDLPETPRRTQDRLRGGIVPTAVPEEAPWEHFVNEPDTDFSLPHHADWAAGIVASWLPRCDRDAASIPLVIEGSDLKREAPLSESYDPSRPGTVVARCTQGDVADVDRAVQCAAADPDGWRGLTPTARSAVLAGVARELRAARANLMGAALADAGKAIAESDPEVSEAVDFVEFYRRSAASWFTLEDVVAQPRGVVVVVSPWNFPIAIPCGGIAAALAAGNTVILKPSSDAVLVAHTLCQCFWRAGVSKSVLQFLPCPGGGAGRALVTHPEVDSVILTGGTATALAMLRDQPRLQLFAETGGKNATIVTALADRDQAIKNVLHSAFSHSGQKCSATSLLILEAEVYEDEHFKNALCDAAASLRVGSSWDLDTKMGPLIRPPSGDLARGLTKLEPGESWALEPENRDNNPHLYSPGIKWGVQPGSFTHRTELFGPVLGVMRARNLQDAIGLANDTGYGLTAGLESLDDREREIWRESMRAGNLYLNRPTTGAVVLRQPFGGIAKSAIGPGIKAGGPNYVAQFIDFTDATSSSAEKGSLHDPDLAALLDALSSRTGDLLTGDDLVRIAAAFSSYQEAIRTEFARVHDHFRLIGQDNYRRYRAIRELRVRVHPADTAFEIIARIGASKTAGCRITVSYERGTPLLEWLEKLTAPWPTRETPQPGESLVRLAGAIEFIEESDDDLAAVIRHHDTDRIRFAAPHRVSSRLLTEAAATGFYIADTPVLAAGRLEFLHYCIEQSISHDYHRYGNLGARAEEARAGTL